MTETSPRWARAFAALTATATLFGCANDAPAETHFYCRYENPFANTNECLGYLGAGWTETSATADCAEIFTGTVGELSTAPCPTEGALGTCTVDGALESETVTWFYEGELGLTESACEGLAGGVFSEGGEVPPTEARGELMAEALDAMRSDATVAVSPECVDDACLEPLVEARGAITFTPLDASPTTGVIVYPGALVDPRAYAPLARALAARGLLVAVVPMPSFSALGGIDRAEDVMLAHPAIDRWVLGGHSLGGAMAARYVRANPGVVDGLFLWAAFPGDEDALSDRTLPVVSIYGTADGVATPDEIDASRALLPASARFEALVGGNHAQFGFYGAQDGDGVAEITRAHQADLVVAATLQLSRRAAGDVALDPRFTSVDFDAVEAALCGRGQRRVAGLDEDQLPEGAVGVVRHEAGREFAEDKPVIDDAGDVLVPLYRHAAGNPEHLFAPAVLGGELWCKFASSERLGRDLALTPGSAGTCADLNADVVAWALEQLDADERAALEAAWTITFGEDARFDTGAEWIADGRVTREVSGGTLVVTGATLATALDDERVPEAARGVYYCKVWNPADALRWALAQGAP